MSTARRVVIGSGSSGLSLNDRFGRVQPKTLPTNAASVRGKRRAAAQQRGKTARQNVLNKRRGIQNNNNNNNNNNNVTPRHSSADRLLLCEGEFHAGDFLQTSVESRKPVISATVIEHIDTVEFFRLFFADGAALLTEYRAARGDTELQVDNWSVVDGLRVRKLNYRAPVKAAIGPNTTRCTETQRYFLSHEQLCVDVVALLIDIPYGDYFRVETSWRVTKHASIADSVQVDVSVGVHFVKRTMFRGKIERGTVTEIKESLELWLKLAQPHIARLVAQRNGASSTAAATASSSTTPSLTATPTTSTSTSTSAVYNPATTGVVAPMMMSNSSSQHPKTPWLHYVAVFVALLAVIVLWRIERQLASINASLTNVVLGG